MQRLLLKWGGLKGWSGFDDAEHPAAVALQAHFDLGLSMSAACQDNTPAHKQTLCDCIDALDGDIQNDWTGEIMTKEAAKAYIMNYR